MFFMYQELVIIGFKLLSFPLPKLNLFLGQCGLTSSRSVIGNSSGRLYNHIHGIWWTFLVILIISGVLSRLCWCRPLMLLYCFVECTLTDLNILLFGSQNRFHSLYLLRIIKPNVRLISPATLRISLSIQRGRTNWKPVFSKLNCAIWSHWCRHVPAQAAEVWSYVNTMVILNVISQPTKMSAPWTLLMTIFKLLVPITRVLTDLLFLNLLLARIPLFSPGFLFH